MTSEQIRQARRLLGMTQEDLAYLSGVSRSQIQALEAETQRPKYTFYEWDDRVAAIRAALEAAGVTFHCAEPGVSLRSNVGGEPLV